MIRDLSRRAAAVSAVATTLVLAPTAAPALADSAPTNPSGCPAPALSQPFAASADFNWYAYAPGESADSFTGEGWALSGGAAIQSTQLADGATGVALDLPSGAQAVSPVMCVNSNLPQLRAMVRTVSGGGGVAVAVIPPGAPASGDLHAVGNLNGPGHGWGLSGQVGLPGGDNAGWHLVQFVLTASGNHNEYAVYDLAAQADASLAASSVDTSACTPPTLAQPFLSAKDSAFYTTAPGESAQSFDGAGWTLTGGAQIAQAPNADGTTTSVLDLPAGSKAVSPVMCVTSDYPTARSEVRGVSGGGGVALSVAYDGTTTWNAPHHTGDLNGPDRGWGLSGRVNIQPGHQSGWQLVQFTLTPKDSVDDVQVLNFEVDPRCRY